MQVKAREHAVVNNRNGPLRLGFLGSPQDAAKFPQKIS
jgi:hypothetical protein